MIYETYYRLAAQSKVPRRRPLRKTWHPEDAHVTADELCFSAHVPKK